MITEKELSYSTHHFVLFT